MIHFLDTHTHTQGEVEYQLPIYMYNYIMYTFMQYCNTTDITIKDIIIYNRNKEYCTIFT